MDADTRGHDQNIKEKPCTCTRSRKYKENKDKAPLETQQRLEFMIPFLGAFHDHITFAKASTRIINRTKSVACLGKRLFRAALASKEEGSPSMRLQ
ncbi:hypothetical protein IGI04_042627 [Brassica rapa subsp. trilocularis]|uniref:Uncharacterized protein n=1 Tax=Brassica rapa subsp. trilocularis TaxID=1813537 RepID=A0ABQ7KHW2_BRACM|nr:hypothetical protein IGI04_042627 [Brassica rapa subsp. trilocularis]